MTEVYKEYYEKHGRDRNDFLRNPEVTFQIFAIDRANIRALRRLDLNPATAKVLDVGCGNGTSLFQFLRLGFRPENMSGVDTSEERIAAAKIELPSADFRCESAEAMSYESGIFDLVFESTLFMMLTSDGVASRVAKEMIRVTRPGGYVMLADWRYAEPRSKTHKAVSPKRIRALFDVGSATNVVARERGALIPPLGRFLSHRAPALYFVMQTVFPPAVGQVTTVLRKANA
ncbi:MAG TPA: class I SAM-dependent methyltransferase [Gemmatimonadaceae bacterium]